MSFGYDALGRNLTQAGPHGTLTSSFDAAGRRSTLSWADGFSLAYNWLATGEMSIVGETSFTGSGVAGAFGYDALGRRTSLARTSAMATQYVHDGGSRLTSLGNYFNGNGNDIVYSMTHNPAGQILSRTGDHNLYVFSGHGNGSTSSTIDGQNRIVVHGGASFGYDWKGNLVADGSTNYVYDSENRLLSASGAKNATLSYDPLGRLYQVSSPAGTTRFEYDGLDLVAEYDSSGNRLRRYAHGPGMDEPLLWYEGGWTTSRRYLIADERGSIVGAFDGEGLGVGYKAYDEYGVTQTTWGNGGRFGYTGQAYIPELGLYYYKNRLYNPKLGRFMQKDPIGYGAGMNLYAYVKGDPVNFTDPLGLCQIYTGSRICRQGSFSAFIMTVTGGSAGGGGFGHFEKVREGGPARAIGGGIEVTSTLLWVESSWGFDDFTARYMRDVVEPALRRTWSTVRKHANAARCVVGNAGILVEEMGKQVTSIGGDIATVGMGVAVAGAVTAQPEVGAIGIEIARQGAFIMTAGGTTSLIGAGMRAVGGDYGSLPGRVAVRALGGRIPDPVARPRATSSANQVAAPSSNGIPACG